MPRKAEPPMLEWITGILGAVVFLGLIAVTLKAALNPQTPPSIQVEITRIEKLREGYVVEFTARNKGNTTGAAVTLVAILKIDGAVVEERTAQLDYLPAGSLKKGGFFFRKDPGMGDLNIEADGFTDP